MRVCETCVSLIMHIYFIKNSIATKPTIDEVGVDF